MTPSKIAQINARIAEACGWTNIREQDYCEAYVNPCDGPVLQFWQGKNPETGDLDAVPNYLGSLDACAEFEAAMTDDEFWEYRRELRKITDRDKGGTHIVVGLERAFLFATDAQRCEAFFRVKGWEWPGEGE